MTTTTISLLPDVSALTWEPRLPDCPQMGFLARERVEIFGCPFHVEARPVEMVTGSRVHRGHRVTAQSEQWGILDDVEDELQHLRHVNDAWEPYVTVKIHGYDCVVTLTPYCD